MSSTLWIGTTGLTASEKQMDVIGNNLANANTVGFKAADTYFASMLSQSMSGGGGGSQRVGQGVGVSSVSTQFSQGSFQSTGNATDLAIDGNGFFILKDKEGATLYTRAGAFEINKEGILSDINKYSVQGHMFDEDGKVELQSLSELNLRNIQSKPSATTYFEVGLTLDSDTTVGSSFNTSQAVYDSRGAKHTLGTSFTKTENSSYWGVQNTLDDIDATSQTYSGIKFNSQGLIEAIYSSSTANTVITAADAGAGATEKINKPGQLYKSTTSTIILTRGADENSWTITDNGGYSNMSLDLGVAGDDDQVALDLDGAGGADITYALGGTWAAGDTIKFDILQSENAPVDGTLRFYAQDSSLTDGATIGSDGDITWNIAGDDAPSLRSYATTSRISSLRSDGYAPGILTSLDIDKTGIVEGMFSNGQRQKLARILLADFANIQGLNKVGSYFTETDFSGKAVFNNPGSGGLGELQSHSLETSNTDVAKEFIKMITSQRAYQSSARIITTADQMLQELMNIKR